MHVLKCGRSFVKRKIIELWYIYIIYSIYIYMYYIHIYPNVAPESIILTFLLSCHINSNKGGSVVWCRVRYCAIIVIIYYNGNGLLLQWTTNYNLPIYRSENYHLSKMFNREDIYHLIVIYAFNNIMTCLNFPCRVSLVHYTFVPPDINIIIEN